MVDTACHHIVKTALQVSLVHIVLVLANPDRFRVDLYQFCQWIHQSPADGYGSPDGHILIREFLPRRIGCRINRCAALADHHQLNIFWEIEASNKSFRLPSPCPVPDGNGLYAESPAHLKNLGACIGSALFGLEGINRLSVEQLPLPVETDYLASGSETGINGKNILLTQGRSQEKLAEVLDKYPYRLLVRPLLSGHADLGLHRRRKKSLVAIVYGHPDLLGSRSPAFNKKAIEEAQGFFFRRQDPECEKTLFFPPPHGKNPVGRGCVHRFFPVKVILVLDSFGLLLWYDL